MTEPGDVITLLDEDGKTHEFSLVDVVEVDERQYAILQPSDHADPAVVFRVDGDTLVAVEDEAEFRKVAAAIGTRLSTTTSRSWTMRSAAMETQTTTTTRRVAAGMTRWDREASRIRPSCARW